MDDSPDPNQELEPLLVELVDGELTPAQRLRLMALLRDDPAACRRYTKYLMLDSLLAWELSLVAKGVGGAAARSEWRVGEGDVTDTPGAAPMRGRASGAAQTWWKRSGRLRSLAVAAASAVIVSLLVGRLVASKKAADVPPKVVRPIAAGGGGQNRMAGDGTRAVPTPVAPKNVAVLTRAINPVWGPTNLPTDLGSALTAGRLRLNSGLIQLEFYEGAVVVLEGPADFELIAADRAFCRQGKLRARVPPKSNRFTVGTPNTDVVDLGTEFGVLVDDGGGSEVQVFEGSVNLQGQWPDIARRAAIDDRREGAHRPHRRSPGGPDRPRFVRRNPGRCSNLRPPRPVAATAPGWTSAGSSGPIRAVLVYYSFEGQQPWERTLLDQAVGRGPNRNGGIVGCEWTEGRWPGKMALDFKRTSDRVLVDIPGEFAALTLMTWVRVDYFDNRLNALLLSDGWEPHELHWELDGKGILIFALKNGARCDSPVVLGENQLGLWTHLATVYAPARRSLAHYVNGREVKRIRIPATGRVLIGSANLGNYTDPPPDVRSDRVIRNLNGRIDEFVIFDQALDAEEIQAIYDVGKPAS